MTFNDYEDLFKSTFDNKNTYAIAIWQFIRDAITNKNITIENKCRNNIIEFDASFEGKTITIGASNYPFQFVIKNKENEFLVNLYGFDKCVYSLLGIK